MAEKTDLSPYVTIVSGLPRSGTSVMMQMLDAGGLPALTDNLRRADDDNPRGYYEFEPVKGTKRDPSWLASAPGKVVKMVHLLLNDLPADGTHQYRVILMRRDLSEVLASQKKMLQRLGRAGGAIGDAQLTKLYEDQLAKVKSSMAASGAFRVLEVGYDEVIASTAAVAARVNEFLDRQLDESKMIAAVDPSLYRNRKS